MRTRPTFSGILALALTLAAGVFLSTTACAGFRTPEYYLTSDGYVIQTPETRPVLEDPGPELPELAPVQEPSIEQASIPKAPFINPKPQPIVFPEPEDRTPPDITRIEVNRMELAITFDGGSDSDEAAPILDALKERGIKTTFFLTGDFIWNHPEIVKRIVAEGHEVGNHTMTHPHLTDYARTSRHATLKEATREFLVEELEGAAISFKAITGMEMAPLWRAPYGEINTELRRWAFEAGYIHIGWTSEAGKGSLDTLDWVHDRSSRLYRTASDIKNRILDFDANGGIKGGIILMHLGTERKSDKATEVLGELLDELMGRGYSFVRISRLLEGAAFIEAARQARSRSPYAGKITAISAEGVENLSNRAGASAH